MRTLVAAVFAGFALWLGAAAAGPANSVQSQPLQVRFGLFVSSIHELDLASGRWGVEFYGWFVFKDESFDPIRAVEVLGSGPQVVEILRRRADDGSTYVAFRGDAWVSGNFDLRSYPFDSHELTLNFEFTEPADRVEVVPDIEDSRVADFVALRGWHVGEPRLEVHQREYDTSFGNPGRGAATFSRATLTIPIERVRSAFLIDQFPGFAVCILISLLIYLVRCDQLSVRVGMVTSAIFAAVGNRYTLNATLGTEAGFGLVDKLTIVAFASILSALAVSLLVFHLNDRYGAKIAWRVDRGVLVVSAVVWLGLAALILMDATS